MSTIAVSLRAVPLGSSAAIKERLSGVADRLNYEGLSIVDSVNVSHVPALKRPH